MKLYDIVASRNPTSANLVRVFVIMCFTILTSNSRLQSLTSCSGGTSVPKHKEERPHVVALAPLVSFVLLSQLDVT